MANVFICYDRDDRDFAEVVQAKLERAGHATAMDFDILSAGDDWQDRLDDAIRRSHALVVIMTPEARQSDYVAYEWAFALGAAVKVIPIELKTTSFFQRLHILHRLDFTNGARPWDTLLAEVQKAAAARPDASLDVDAAAPAAVKQAARAIDSLDAGERIAALKTLAQMNHAAARDVLIRALEHPVSDVRLAAACFFPDRTDPRTVPGLIAAYQEDFDASPGYKWFDHQWLGDRLEEVGAPAAPYLLDAITGADVWLRRELLDALSSVADGTALPALIAMLDDDDAYTRATATVTLGRIGDASAGPALLNALADDDVDVRKAAAASLGSLKLAAAVPALITLLQEDSRSVQAIVARSLGTIGDRAAVPALIAALVEDDYDVRAPAARALARIGDPAAVPHLRKLLDAERGKPESTTEPIGAIMDALARLGDTESFDMIEQRLIAFRSGSFGDFEEVCYHIAQTGTDGVARVIRVLQSATSSSVRDHAARALARCNSPEASAAVREWKRKRP